MTRLGATVVAGGTRFEVWAPHASSVDVVVGERSVPLSRTDHVHDPGVPTWIGTVDGVGAGDAYGFRLDGGEPLPDPASRLQADGVHGRSTVVDLSTHDWNDAAWTGVSLADAVLYELHVGTFTSDGTFDAAIGELPRLAALGVTVLEVMPVNAVPGVRNWGYDGVFPFATQAAYGGPAAFARFVDAAHGLGLGVILDVVYNHLGPEGNVLGRFGPYLTDAYRTPWGPAINVAGPGSDGVRRYLMENVRTWVEDLHLDGFRMDAVHAIVDPTARPVVGELVGAAREAGAAAGRSVLVTVESAANDPRIVRPPERGGLGADAVWNDDVHHALRVALTGERHEYYAAYRGAADLVTALERRWVYDGQYSPTIGRRHGAPATDVDAERFVVFSTNHDHVGNTPSGDRMLADADPTDPRHRLRAAFVLLSPFTPLLFMGEEYGEPAPFPFFVDHGDPEVLEATRRGRAEEFADQDWAEVADPADPATFRSAVLDPTIVERDRVRHGRSEMYAELLRLRRRLRPTLVSIGSPGTVQSEGDVVRSVVRHEGTDLVVEFNFSDSTAEVDEPGELVFSSLDQRWTGRLDGAVGASTLGPWEARVSLRSPR